MGIVIGEHWRAWRLLPGWNSGGRDIGWAEALGFYLLAATIFASGNPEPCYKVYGDNRGVVEGWWRGSSKNRPTNEVFKLVHDACERASSQLITRYVPSNDNPADGPSRGDYPPSSLLLPAVPIPLQWRQFLVDFDAPRHLSEVRAAQSNHPPSPHPKPQRDSARVRSTATCEQASEHIAKHFLAQSEAR